jgi:tetratricopeptide (TPR) repeat protein
MVGGLAGSPGCPRRLVERLLAAARRGGDRRQEAAALADLGSIRLHEGDAEGALAYLEEALAAIRPLGDRCGEGDILGEMGLAALVAGRPRRALELLEQARARAREAGDRFAEKTAWERLGLAHEKLADFEQALASFERALGLAREVGDRKQEADLLWLAGIQLAELGRREQAVAHARAAVEVLRASGKPEAVWFADHLQRYGEGETGTRQDRSSSPAVGESSEALLGDPVVANRSAVLSESMTATGAEDGPGLLRRAVSAAKSMAQFLGSGLRTVPPPTLQRRLRTCMACEHHTGLRCRLCGCFTNVKARLAHEACLLEKWPN